MNDDDINTYMPSILNPRTMKRQHENLTLTQNSIVSRCSLSLKRNRISKCKKNNNKTFPVPIDKENSKNTDNFSIQNFSLATNKDITSKSPPQEENISGIEDLIIVDNINLSPFIFENGNDNKSVVKYNESILAKSSVTELYDYEHYVLDTDCDNKIPVFSVSFGVTECENVNISTKNSNIQRILVSRKKNNDMTLDCELVEATQIYAEKDIDENVLPSPPKRLAVDVNLEIKKENPSTSEDATEKSKVLILKTDAIEKLSHVIVQPPNYNLVKRQISNKSKLKSSIKKKTTFKTDVKNGNNSVRRGNLRQSFIEDYLSRGSNVLNLSKVSQERVILKLSNSNVYNGCLIEKEVRDDAQDMSKNSGVADTKCERIGRTHNAGRRENEVSPRSGIRISSSKRENISPKRDIKTSCLDAPRGQSPRSKNDSIISHSPRKNAESIQFNLPTKSKSNKTSVSTKIIPHYKIVAGTHFAVDAFSYGDIPNVKHYFLTHFHSDHYSGLKRTFNKLLFCSKITADLCVSRLGVNPKCIHIINLDETIRVEGVEVTSIDANHCPGAIMLVFTLPNGKTILHTGDFRASPAMESYPIFWNKDIHTVYLDTTYCNPRYDFPTQDQSLEMALYQLRQKKMMLEKAGKKFSSVLIVCGTYTIGKEKFFLGMARRVGCSVWACPEKDRVLQAVEGRSFSHAPPSSCQLHVVPMRDLTHEKLRSYLDSLQGAFNEVVAFKPSGWENGKNSSVEKDFVTIHGIPYSEHSSFSEMIRFVKYLKPKQVVPTVDISGGIKAVQKYFPCPLVYKEDTQSQSKVTDYFSIQNRQQVPAVT